MGGEGREEKSAIKAWCMSGRLELYGKGDKAREVVFL